MELVNEFEYLSMNETHMEMQTQNVSYSEDIILNMQMLSMQEGEYPSEKYIDTSVLLNDLFENNLDVYNPSADNPLYEKYKVIHLGIPNIYCTKYFDDEDFIYSHLDLPEEYRGFLRQDNTIVEYSSIVNYNENGSCPEIIFTKIKYIYQFVYYYFTTLNTLSPEQRVRHLPCDFLVWVDNIVSILRNVLGSDIFKIDTSIIETNDSLKCDDYEYGNYYDEYNYDEYGNIQNPMKDYYNELSYGLTMIVCHLKMILNHHKFCKIPFWSMELKYINKLFQLLNNLCVIIIFMKMGF